MRRALYVVVPLAALALGLLLERAIVTDREAVEALLDDVAERARRGDWEGVRAALADDFEAMEPEEFVERARGLVGRGPTGWRMTIDDVEVQGDEGAVRATVRMSAFGGFTASGRVGVVRQAGGWRIRSVRPDDPRHLR